MLLRTQLSEFLLCLVIAFPAMAQRARITDPQALSASGNGWSVDPLTGAMRISIPVAMVPGDIPIPVSLRMNATATSRSTTYYEWEPTIKRWLLSDGPITERRPVYATQHLGYISKSAYYGSTLEPNTYVLESGLQFREPDLVSYSSWNTGTTFNLPTAFQLSSKATSGVKVIGTGQIATYEATNSELGDWAATATGLNPSGYTLPSPMNYQVIIDKDRARVMMFLSEFNAWVPILWLDRYGHSVSFKWTRSTSGLVAGIAATHMVQVTNNRGFGVRLQWAQWSSPFPATEQTLLFTQPFDSTGTASMPGITVTGYVGSDSMGDTNIVPNIPGPIGRPTTVQVGPLPQTIPLCWSQNPPAAPIHDGGSSLPPLLWTFGYDSTKSILNSITEANGTSTQFQYGSFTLAPASGNYAVRLSALIQQAVTSTTSTDSPVVQGDTPRVLNRTWTRSTSASGEPITIQKEAFGDIGSIQRYTELTFASPSDAVNYGNGALKTLRVMSADGTRQWSKVTTTYSVAGTDGTYSMTSSQVVERDGEPSYKVENSLNTNGLQVTKSTHFVGTSNLKVSDVTRTFETMKDMLDIERPNQVVTTRYLPNGTVLAPVRTQKVSYFPDGKPARVYLDGGGLGQVGNQYGWDAEGRLGSIMPYSSTQAAGFVSKSNIFDPATGNLTIQRTTFRDNLVVPAVDRSMEKTFSNFDADGRPQKITDERGVETNVTFDIRGRLITSQKAGEAAIGFTYPDELTREITREGLKTVEHRDGFGRVLSVDTPDGRTITYGYDIHGRNNLQRVQTATGLSSPLSILLDPLDRIVSRTNPAGMVEGFTYAANGNLAKTTATVDSTGVNAVTVTNRDAFGQVVSATSPNGTQTQANYDGLGNAVQVTQSPSTGTPVQIRSFGYDALGRLTSKTEPETGTTTFSGFNLYGQPSNVTEEKDVVGGTNRGRIFSFDNLGRLRGVMGTLGGNTSLGYTYSGLDLVSMTTTNSDGSVVTQDFEYLGGAGKRLSKETTTTLGWTGVIQYGYDPAGRLSTMTYPSGRVVNYGFDVLGRVNRVDQGGTPLITAINYSEWSSVTNVPDWGSVEHLAFSSGAYDDWSTQKNDSQTKDWVLGFKDANGVIQTTTRNHAFNSAGQMTQAGEWSLLHDKENRLLNANASTLGAPTTTHDYDAFNNAISATTSYGSDAALPTFSVPVMADNRVPPSMTGTGNPTGWDYNLRGEARSVGVMDGSGNLLRTLRPTFDLMGRLTQLQENSGGPIVHQVTYAPSGLRTRVIDPRTPSNNRRYAYTASGLLLGEYNDAGGWLRDAVYVNGRIVAEVDGNGVHELHTDHLGTPRVVTIGAGRVNAGQIEATQAFGPYGERLSNAQAVSGTYLPLIGYTGHAQTDPTGLIYMRGRYFSPQWRHFLNSDQGVDPYSMNQMAYVGGSPFRFVDPSGMKIRLLYVTWVCDSASRTGDTEKGPWGPWHCDQGHWEAVYGDDGSGDGGGGSDGGGDGADPGGDPSEPQAPKPTPPPCLPQAGNGVYRQNRVLGGRNPLSNNNPISHTFIFTTDAFGRVSNTYSWGNNGYNGAWVQNAPEDVFAANQMILNGTGLNRVAGIELVGQIQPAFDILTRISSEVHPNGGVVSNCKVEADNLIDYARTLPQ